VTLINHPDLIQGSEEWLAARRGIVTASVVGQLITASTLKVASNDYSRALTASLVAERITGHTDPVFVTSDMLRGTLDEPIARAIYAEHYAPVDETGFMVRDEGDWRLGFSPDGLVGTDGLLEIKSRRAKKQLTTILNDTVPAENVGQLQAGLLVTGREWIDYVSFSGGMPLYVKRVYPDQRWFDAIIAAVTTFEQTAAEMVERYFEATKDMPATERVDHFAEIVL
jgi:YqaJ-like viral recombinase domain